MVIQHLHPQERTHSELVDLDQEEMETTRLKKEEKKKKEEEERKKRRKRKIATVESGFKYRVYKERLDVSKKNGGSAVLSFVMNRSRMSPVLAVRTINLLFQVRGQIWRYLEIVAATCAGNTE